MGQSAEQRRRREETRDNLLMNMRGGYGSAGIPGILFLVPQECKSPDARKETYAVDEGKAPGVYLLGNKGRSGNRDLMPEHQERLLTREEAMQFASAIDQLAHPSPQSLGRGEEDGYYPATYLELVVAWYAALARRLDRAIDSSRNREAQLREVRASLTGKVG